MSIKKTIQEKLAPMVVTERDETVSQRDELKSLYLTDGILHHHPRCISGREAISEGMAGEPDDAELVKRLISSYAKVERTPLEPQGPFWSVYLANHNQETHAILIDGNVKRVAYMLRNPATSMLFYGFDSLSSADAPKTKKASWRQWLHLLTYDSLLQIAEIVGTVRIQYPEAPMAALETASSPDVETLLLGADRN